MSLFLSRQLRYFTVIVDRDGIKRLEIVVDCVTAAIFITSPKWAPSLLLLPPPTARGDNHSSLKLKDPQSNWHVQ